MTPHQVECAGCGTLVIRYINLGGKRKPFKCFDCKKQVDQLARQKRKLTHKITHTFTVDNANISV